MATPNVQRMNGAGPSLRMGQPTTEPRPQALLGLLVALGILIVGGLLDPNFSALFLGFATCAVAVASLAIHALHRPLDRTTLTFVGNVALILMFGLHPVAMVVSGMVDQPFHFKFDLRPTYTAAVLIGLIATMAFNVGALLGSKTHTIVRRPAAIVLRSTFTNEANVARFVGVSLVVVALGGYSLFALSTGQNPLIAILSGARRGAETGSTAYFYLAPLLLGPAALLLLVSALKRGKFPVLAALVLGLQALLFLPGGQRIVLILSALPTVLAWFMLTRRRFSTPVLIVVFFASFLVLVSLRDLGTAGGPSLSESLQQSFGDPGVALTETLTGDDSEMVDSVAILLQAVPSQLPHQPLHSVAALISSPVPSNLWAGKPQPMDSTVNALLLGTQSNSAGLAYSFAGELYFDGGQLTVCLGFLLLGFVAARLTNLYLRTENAYVVLIYASLAGALINLMRGSMSYTFARLLFTTAPLIAFAIYVHFRTGRQKREKKRPNKLPYPSGE